MKYSEDGKTFELDIPVGSDVYIFIGKPENEVVAKTNAYIAQISFYEGKFTVYYHSTIKTIIHSNSAGYMKGDTVPAGTLCQYTFGEDMFLTIDDIKAKIRENRKKAKK